MNNSLDSRALQQTDCYGQRFMRAGDYRYNIVPAHGHHLSTDRPFLIRVRQGSGKEAMKQHNVRVVSEGRKFNPGKSELEIDVGDLVVWNGGGRHAYPYAVVSDHDFFGSHRLVNESGYSHAFGMAGEYRWVDAFGSGLSGTVKVTDPDGRSDASLKRWRESLRKGTLVMINGTKPEPRAVEIFTGQTIYFAVVKGPGITITDSRLLLQQPKPDKPSGKKGGGGGKPGR